MKKKLVFILSTLLLVSIVAGCKQDKPQPSSNQAKEPAQEAQDNKRKIVVLLPNHEMDNKRFMESQTREFENETGITVELINMGWDNVADRVMTELTEGGSSFDVIEFDNAWVAKFINNDWVEPLDSYINTRNEKWHFTGSA